MTKNVKNKLTLNSPRTFDIIRAPHITEKSTAGAVNNRYSFEVAMDATKPEIRQAVEALFKVKVESINTLIRKGKEKRFRGIKGVRPDMKIATVRLAKGEVIDTGAKV